MLRRKDAVFYVLYFQEPGVAEAELERDVREAFLKMLGGGSVADGLRERPSAAPPAWYRARVDCSVAG
jgi:hypothetical protein